MEKEEELHEFKLDTKILKAEPPCSLNTGLTISSDKWKKTYRKTDAMELTKIIKDTTITQSSLIRLTGSYSTKMLQKLSVNKKMVSGIESRPSKVFYNRNYSLSEVINNDMLSYIPYIFNHLNTNKEDTKDKLYLDNFMVINGKIYFNLYLDEELLITVEGIHLDPKSLITNNIPTSSNGKDYLKIFITDSYNHQMALNKITSNFKGDFMFITVNKYFKKINISLYNKGTQVALTKENLLRLKDVHFYYKDKDLYVEIKNKYEFERKVIK